MSPIHGDVFDAYDTLIAAGELLFVSSNAWDVAGAKAFGHRVAWCNRTSAPEEELGVRPTEKRRRLASREPPVTA